MKKDLENPQYWDLFGRGLLAPEDRPKPQEACDYYFALLAKVKAAEEEAKQAKHEAKCANQQFKVFAMEVSNLALKYQR